jgi:hypothetical protein
MAFGQGSANSVIYARVAFSEVDATERLSLKAHASCAHALQGSTWWAAHHIPLNQWCAQIVPLARPASTYLDALATHLVRA